MAKLVVPKELSNEELSDLERLAKYQSGRDYSTDGLDIYTCTIPVSGSIAGDYVGVVRDENNARIVTVDGMGKGARAFYHAYMVTREFFVGAHTDGDEPALENISRKFAEASLSSDFFFSAFMLLSLQQGLGNIYTLGIYGMGQPSPLIYKHKTEELVTVPQLNGVAVGVPVNGSEKPYSSFFTSLEPGDMLLAFSDGVTEARNPRGTMFSDAKWGIKMSFLCSVKYEPWRHADEIVQDIRDDIVAYCGNPIITEPKLQDDITLVAVRVKRPDDVPWDSRRKNGDTGI